MNTPNIRFKGFNNAWEQRKLSEVANFIRGSFPQPYTNPDFYDEYGGKPFVQVGDIGMDLLLNDDTKAHISSLAEKKSRFVKSGTVIVALQGSIEKSIGRTAITQYDAFIDRTILIFESYKIPINKLFFAQTIKSLFEKEKEKAWGATISTITKEHLSNFIIGIPNVDEQKRLGEYFKNLDNLITLHQRKCDSLKQVKKYMLQKMFPKQGEKVPEIRFAGFTGDWEQRKYSDIATTRRGLTYKPDNIVDDGKRVLRSSNINEDTFEIHNDDVFVGEDAINIPYVKNGDILITSANGSSRLVGKHAIIRDIPDNAVVHGGFMLIASSDEPEFVNALMSSQWYTKFINIYVAGGNGAIGNLNKNDLDEQIVFVPSKGEREKIGTLFANLDTLITLHQRKSDSLKEIKKFMLQNMFPQK